MAQLTARGGAPSRRRLGALLLALGLLLVLGGYLARLFLVGGVEFRRGGPAFALLVDRHVADFPLAGRAGPARYSHDPQDGLKPRRLNVRFDSRLPPEAVRAAYAAACRERGYLVGPDPIPARSDLLCSKRLESIEVQAHGKGDGSAVRLQFEQDLSG